MKVLIVGGGIGGLTLGAFLKRCDIDFELIEKKTNFDSEGYSIGLWDNGRDILRKLGLEDKLDSDGEEINDFLISDGRGKVFKRYSLRNFYREYGTAYTHISRKKVHDWLLDLAGFDKIRMGKTIKSLVEQKDGMLVEFSDGSSSSYDVVVGADGIHSEVRKLTFGPRDYEHYSEWRLWLGWIDNKFKKDRTVIQYIAPQQFASIFDDSDRALLALVAPIKHSVWDTEEGRVQRLIKTFDKLDIAQDVLPTLKDTDLMPTNLSFIRLNTWTKGRVVLVGDSAHAMEPFGGLGAAMAMEDAYILSAELSKVANQAKSVEAALGSYQEKRMHRIKHARYATRGMRWWSISRTRLFTMLIKLLAPILPEQYFTRDFHALLKEEI